MKASSTAIKSLKEYFSKLNITFLKDLTKEEQKVDLLLDNNKAKEQKYSLFLTALIAKDYSTTNKQYFIDVKNTYSLLEENTNNLKKLKKMLNGLNSKVLNLTLSEQETDSQITYAINSISKDLNSYAELVDEVKPKLIENNTTINTFTSYHSTRLLLTTFDMDLGDTLEETADLSSPKIDERSLKTSYSDIVTLNENKVLIISEKDNKVYLPYRKTELKAYLSQYPSEYYSYKNVIEKEFILPLNRFMDNQQLARFRETYTLYRDREASSSIVAFNQALRTSFKSDLNPAIIAACKTKKQLTNYILCLNDNNLDEFTDFEIIYDMAPATVTKVTKPVKPPKTEKTEKVEKIEKTDKIEKTEKIEKPVKSEKVEKTDNKTTKKK